MKKHIVILLTIIFYSNGYAQNQVIPLTNQEKLETLNSIKNILKENYIFPEITDKIVLLIESNQKKSKYNSIRNPNTFAEILTNNIQSFNNDKHLRVLFEPDRIAKLEVVVSAEDSIKFEQEYISNLKKNNYYFKQVKILDGNIGYLDLRKFRDPKYAGETAISAMNFLSNSDAVIIDLRNNGGGTPKMVQLIASYFFNSEVVQLSSVYKRKERITKQFWTLPFVSGKRMPDVPLYILTSSSTFSAAESFAYDMQSLKRAIIIGETTGGGAHPGGRIKATEKFNVWTPTGRAINPITKTNWEKVGVIPQVETSSKEALLTAHIMALDSLKRKNEKLNEERYYEWHLQALNAEKKPFDVHPAILKKYIGNYGIRTISLEKSNLYYQRNNSTKLKLIPLSDNTFMLTGISDFRIKFVKNESDSLTLIGIYEDGKVVEYPKIE